MRLFSWLPERYHALSWVVVVFLGINTLTRLGLWWFADDTQTQDFALFAQIFGVGLVHDSVVASVVLIPFMLLAWLIPNSPRGQRIFSFSAMVLLALSTFGFLFTALAEGTFWNEFASRFNFIAVDYLIYTREVLGNIWQSYPVVWLLSGIAVIAAGILWGIASPFWHSARAEGGSFWRRTSITVAYLFIPVMLFSVVTDSLRERFSQPAAKELASNGYYEFVRAFRANELDFFKFYKTLPVVTARNLVQRELKDGEPNLQFTNPNIPVEHRITPTQPAIKKNVILVSIESLGADYVEAFGGKKGLTPNLDQLAHDGMMFTQLYATGLRTVRGLEALTLSLPPTPGHAVPARKNNTGLQTLGGVFKEQGYKPFYIYGGYSYFDNMQNFFAGNGYNVIDRTQVNANDIHHETIWGIADEDILHHAIGVMNNATQNGEKVFAHIMTTSNHRPYTYPDGRIEIPSGSGREGAVKYTDWAIGNFMKEAKQQPWFKDTLFVFVADHTSHGRGRTDLPPEHYRIPLIVYAPDFIQPAQINDLASQIDVAPTVLGLLNVPYTSQFFGQNILTAAHTHPRAFMSNYLTVGYLEHGKVIELLPKQKTATVDAQSGALLPDSAENQQLINEVIAYYQVAATELNQAATPKP